MKKRKQETKKKIKKEMRNVTMKRENNKIKIK